MNTKDKNGFTLVEMSIAVTITAIIGLAINSMLQSGTNSGQVVIRETRRANQIRRAADKFSKEIRQSQVAKLTIATLADNNHSVTFQLPLSVVAGVTTWGVYDKSLGNTEADRTKAGWFVRYTVMQMALPGGVIEAQLRRQILDATFVLQKEWILVRGLLSGNGPQPGFKLTASGSMWRVQLNVGDLSGVVAGNNRGTDFDIALRN